MKVKKAIFPVAGLGTRFLPATKASPKEMMPIVDMPLIQYAVNEAVAAGITELIFVTNGSKRAIKDHFDPNPELESNLIASGKHELLATIQHILPSGVSCIYVDQKTPLGLGHAVLCAKQAVGNEPFAVLLADDLIESDEKSCLQQMIALFEKKQASIVAIQKIPHSDTMKYGIIDPTFVEHGMTKIKGIIEKPTPDKAPSDLGVVGRYILTPRIFALLESTPIGSNDEVQLTDAIATLLLEQSVYALQFQGKRYDCGTKLGYLEATVAFGLKSAELGRDFKKSLQNLVG